MIETLAALYGQIGRTYEHGGLRVRWALSNRAAAARGTGQTVAALASLRSIEPGASWGWRSGTVMISESCISFVARMPFPPIELLILSGKTRRCQGGDWWVLPYQYRILPAASEVQLFELAVFPETVPLLLYPHQFADIRPVKRRRIVRRQVSPLTNTRSE